MVAELTIALEEGFDDTHVVVAVNGVPQLDDLRVTSRPQIGLAKTITVDVTDGPVTVDVTLPDDGISERIELAVPETTHLGVSKSDGTIAHRVSDRPFGYV